jgi:probable FeS assembly SUF system protein SufT
MSHQITTVELKRDCDAIQIPGGAQVTLPAGTVADITQQLGGTCTLHAEGGLFRVAAKDFDALGLEAPPEPAPTGVKDGPPDEGPVREERVWEALRTCYDPEIPVNIVDLGLVYDLHSETMPGGRSLVSVKMTLTAPGCGMGASIAGDAQQKILALPGVEEAVVEIVWDPPWHQSMITAQGRKILGLE